MEDGLKVRERHTVVNFIDDYMCACDLGRSEKYKSQNFEKVEEDSGPRHSTDFRTVFGIMIGQISSC